MGERSKSRKQIETKEAASYSPLQQVDKQVAESTHHTHRKNKEKKEQVSVRPRPSNKLEHQTRLVHMEAWNGTRRSDKEKSPLPPKKKKKKEKKKKRKGSVGKEGFKGQRMFLTHLVDQIKTHRQTHRQTHIKGA